MKLLKLITLLQITLCYSKILRNNALMNKMMTNFHNTKGVEPEEKEDDSEYSNNNNNNNNHSNNNNKDGKKVLSMLQTVLCKNFPSIPCNLIIQDDTLKKLMERSIQQISYKKMNMERSTTAPGYGLTLFPVINSDELSSFLQVQHTGYFKEKQRKKTNKSEPKTIKNFWSHDHQAKKKIKGMKDKRPEMYTNRKNIRKFYPHKVKHKERSDKNKVDFRDYSEEKLSMSVEIPDMQNARKDGFKPNEEPPVWRIDYMKHGEPSLNMFAYEDDRLRGKIMQTGPSVIVDENILEQAARKDVLHPDVYIKKKFMRKGGNSEGME